VLACFDRHWPILIVPNMHIESASFQNYNGIDIRWNIALTGDELNITNPAAASGGTADLKWKRVK
jgi:hypothetical protein